MPRTVHSLRSIRHRSEVRKNPLRRNDLVVRLMRFDLEQLRNAINAHARFFDNLRNPVVQLERIKVKQLQGDANNTPYLRSPVVRLERLEMKQLQGKIEARARFSDDLPCLPGAPQPATQVPLSPRRRHAEIRQSVHYRDAITAADVVVEELAKRPHHLGPLADGCEYCHACFFSSERQNRQEARVWCCCRGEIVLPPLQPCPDELKALLTEQGPLQRQFRENIRTANSNFAMASFKTSQPQIRTHDQGHWCFHASGKVYHYTEGPATDDELERPTLNQYYCIEPAAAIQHRSQLIGDRVDQGTIATLENMFRRTNIWVRSFSYMAKAQQRIIAERGRDNATQAVERIIFVFKKTPGDNFQLPQDPAEVAAVFFDEDPPLQSTQLKMYPKRPGMHNEIRNLNRLADPFVYPLLFPHGEYGYDMNIKCRTKPNKTVSIRQFYRYRLYTRGEFSTIHHGGKLFQQYIVDAWSRAETSDLWYLTKNQMKFRLVQERTMQRHVNAQGSPGDAPGCSDVGRPLILHAGFQGGQRHHRRQYLDAMATVARHGKPDLFVTFTCNPGWPEIVQNLEDQQRFQDRMDLVCRVFEMKLQAFLHDINHNQIFGIVLSYMYVIEFQKRGLPHAHIVLTFIDQDKIDSEQDIDRIICARIPNSDNQPKLYDVVRNFYVHMPCGENHPEARCMSDGQCTKFYPKNFAEATVMNAGQIEYKRPKDGRTVDVAAIVVDNRRIVPYNPYVAVKYNCHVNVEVCGSLASIKYMHKYVQKGTNQPEQEQSPKARNEIQEYIDRRFVSSTEAAWRLFEFKMQDRSHAVIVLPIHLENDRTVLIEEAEDEQQLNDLLNQRSKLEAAFALNASDPYAKRKFYRELPEYYVWNKKVHTWTRRARVTKVIGAVAEVSPQSNNKELFYMRLLLMHRRGPTSFQDLRTIDGRHCDTYRETCDAMHLLENADEYDSCLGDAALMRQPRPLRQLFAMLCCVIDANLLPKMPHLWQKYLDRFVDDYIQCGHSRRHACFLAYDDVNVRIRRNREDMSLFRVGIHIKCPDDIPQRTGAVDEPASLTYPAEKLNEDQRPIYDEIVQAVRQASRAKTRRTNVFFLDGPGGTGKTYLYNCILSTLRTKGIKTISVAWTGIAATLLLGGKTSHNAFRLPFVLDDTSVAGWPIEHVKSKRMKHVALIIWDEAAMTPSQAVMAVDRYLKDLFDTTASMGGIVTLFGGDFRQILPIVPRRLRVQVINATIKTCQIWQDAKHRKLSVNMRALMADPEHDALNQTNTMAYTDFLLEIGQGTYPRAPKMKRAPFVSDDLIELPQTLIAPDLDSLLDFVYGDLSETQDVGSRALLCPTNLAVDNVNATILAKLAGAQEKRYFSIDKYDEVQENNLHVTDDMLHSMQNASLPPHELTLRIGCVVMLLKNLDLSLGLCNGVRMKIVDLQENLIQAEILTGSNKGTVHLLPKINMISRDVGLPGSMHRFQFPIKLAYAMTINKAQGQTFSKVGVYLNKPCFTHGQLYVALSRVGKWQDVRVYVQDSVHQGKFQCKNKCFTRNVVHRQMFER